MELSSDSDEFQETPAVCKRDQSKPKGDEKELSSGLKGKEPSEESSQDEVNDGDEESQVEDFNGSDEEDSLKLNISEDEVEDLKAEPDKAKSNEEDWSQADPGKTAQSEVDGEPNEKGPCRRNVQGDREAKTKDQSRATNVKLSTVKPLVDYQSNSDRSDEEENTDARDEKPKNPDEVVLSQSYEKFQSSKPLQSDRGEKAESDGKGQFSKKHQSDGDAESIARETSSANSDNESLAVKEITSVGNITERDSSALENASSPKSPVPSSSDEDHGETQSGQEAQSEGGAQSNSDDQSESDLEGKECQSTTQLDVNNEPQSDGEAQSASGSERSPTPPIPSCSDEDDDKDHKPKSDEEIPQPEVQDPSSQRETTTVDLFGELSSDDEAPEEVQSDTNVEQGDKKLSGDVKNEVAVSGDEKEASPNEREQQEVDAPPTIIIDANLPRFNTNLGKEIGFVKLPNFLSVEPRPFDPQLYEDEIDEDEVLDEEGRTRLKLKVENTIRWRMKYDEAKNMTKESNARFIKWSDGSLSLQLGSEMFDIDKNSMASDFNHLFIRQGTGVQGQAVFKTRLTFRPHSTDSFTHRKMALSLADKSTRTQKICILPTVGKNPEANKRALYKHEEKKLKALMKRQSTMVKFKDTTTHRRGLRPSYLEPDRDDSDSDDGDAISLAAIKNKYKKGDRPSIYSSEEESEREKRLELAKRDRVEDDDSDIDYFDKKDAKKKKPLIEDSDDDD